MGETRTFERLRTLLCETLVRPQDSIVEGSSLRELGVTSLDAVEIATDIEEVFGVVVIDEAFKDLVTIADVVAFIDKARAEKT